MSGWPRKLTALVLAVVLAAGVSCTSDNALGPSKPSAPAQMTSDDQQSLLLGEIINGVKNLQLLSCSAQPNVVVTKVVGTAGGTIVVGAHQSGHPRGRAGQELHHPSGAGHGPGELGAARARGSPVREAGQADPELRELLAAAVAEAGRVHERAAQYPRAGSLARQPENQNRHWRHPALLPVRRGLVGLELGSRTPLRRAMVPRAPWRGGVVGGGACSRAVGCDRRSVLLLP